MNENFKQRNHSMQHSDDRKLGLAKEIQELKTVHTTKQGVDLMTHSNRSYRGTHGEQTAAKRRLHSDRQDIKTELHFKEDPFKVDCSATFWPRVSHTL